MKEVWVSKFQCDHCHIVFNEVDLCETHESKYMEAVLRKVKEGKDAV